jgi:hypothetical protein
MSNNSSPRIEVKP